MVNRTLAIAIIISIFLTTWGITVPAIADGSGFLKSDPDYNTIMFCPTPSTLEQGDWYFRDFELLVLNFGYGLTDNLDLSFGTLFPVTGDIELITLGAKLEILDRDTEGLGLALTGGGFILEQYWLVVRAPAGLADGLYDLEIMLEEPGSSTVVANDTEFSSVEYTSDKVDHVLVIDRSGSMGGNKLQFAKDSVIKMIEHLSDQDY